MDDSAEQLQEARDKLNVLDSDIHAICEQHQDRIYERKQLMDRIEELEKIIGG